MTEETESAIREWSKTAEGWCSVERALEMAQLIIDTKPMQVVEIGVFAGGSLVPQALALQENGYGVIYGIDPWSRQAAVEQVFVADDKTPPADEEAARKWWSEVDLDRMLRLCMEGIWKHELEPHAVIIRARSQDCVSLFRPGLTDILYIDGSHSEQASCFDAENYLPMLRHGGYCWFDDCEWVTTQRALGIVEESCALRRDHGNYRLYQKTI